ncbi:GtrA family protein [Nonomuraea diastatica]|uniref:GtrA family protein n=1 Tax=Nonomuraea diastatica TaxID=1848329 RepID=UPI0026B9D92E
MIDLHRFLRGALPRIFTRYTLGSVLAAVVSEVTLLVTYGQELLGAQPAAVAGWVLGAVTNYVLARWAWRRRGRPRVLRELLPFWLTSVAGLLLSTWATGVAHDVGPRLFATDGARVLFVGAVFLGVYGVLFMAKFCFFHYFVFADPRAGSAGEADEEGEAEAEADGAEDPDGAVPRRSRSQVPSTTRK